MVCGMSTTIIRAALACALALAFGCAETSFEEGLPIAGEYQDSYGLRHSLSQESWVWGHGELDQVYDLLQWDAHEQLILAQNRAEPPQFSRFDWRYDDEGRLSYCHTVDGMPTLASALAVGTENCTPGDWITLRTACAPD